MLPLQLTVNGEVRSFEAELTVERLLEVLDLPHEGVAVEVNRSIVPRRAHAIRVLRAGDEVEVVTFVGGG